MSVQVEIRGPLHIVTLNRPEVHNCVDRPVAEALRAAVKAFRDDQTARVLILTGAGTEAFCSGADLKAATSPFNLYSSPDAVGDGPMGISRITDVDKPTIAAINGHCYAGGLELACWCDFRIADEAAQFGVLNRRWGVPLVDGGTQRLPRIVGLGNALYLIETGVRVDARTALRMGLVQEIVPKGKALERAIEFGERIAVYPWHSLLADRLAAHSAWALPLVDGLRLEARLGEATLGEIEMREGLQRYARGDRPAPPTPTGE